MAKIGRDSQYRKNSSREKDNSSLSNQNNFGKEDKISFWRGTFIAALPGSLLFWAALPPLAWWPLAWLAPLPWVRLALAPNMPGKKPYRALWSASFVFWMGALHWLRLPHPATSLGWVALSFYLALYLPAFVGMVRLAVHQLKWPVVIAAPVLWTGLELVQSYLLSGFNMVGLGHTQYQWLTLIQVADLIGVHGVGFLVMGVAAAGARALPLEKPWFSRRPHWQSALWAFGLVASASIYGALRMAEPVTEGKWKVALIQGSIDTELKADPTAAKRIHDEYFQLSLDALRQEADLDLLVWPETMFRQPLLTFDEDAHPPQGAEWTIEDLREAAKFQTESMASLCQQLGTHLILGIDVIHFTRHGEERFNSALLLNPNGKILARYDKMHPVMFGEYVPFAKQFPWLSDLSPIGGGICSGEMATCFEIPGPPRSQKTPLSSTKEENQRSLRLSPSICFESTLPQLFTRQLQQLRSAEKNPDVLVNLTNDGWFWGSSELDMHLICGVFRAVECRKPLLIAANTGFSAWISDTGKIVQQGPRRDRGVIVAQVGGGQSEGIYTTWGVLFSWGCLVAGAISTIIGGVKIRKAGNSPVFAT